MERVCTQTGFKNTLKNICLLLSKKYIKIYILCYDQRILPGLDFIDQTIPHPPNRVSRDQGVSIELEELDFLIDHLTGKGIPYSQRFN